MEHQTVENQFSWTCISERDSPRSRDEYRKWLAGGRTTCWWNEGGQVDGAASAEFRGRHPWTRENFPIMLMDLIWLSHNEKFPSHLFCLISAAAGPIGRKKKSSRALSLFRESPYGCPDRLLPFGNSLKGCRVPVDRSHGQTSRRGELFFPGKGMARRHRKCNFLVPFLTFSSPPRQ